MTCLTIAFSTSSPLASVALISEDGAVLWSGEELAHQNASSALPKLLATGLHACNMGLGNAARFAVDLGPGSFTGVRVGVVFAKALAFGQAVRVGGATSFDLIDPRREVFVPSRQGERFLRIPGQAPVRTSNLPPNAIGYEFGIGGTYPTASAFGPLVHELFWDDAASLLPGYVSEPSVSLPKQPYAERRG
ncbi:MAG: tRNA (adenosine(37)-N6)-threonylcarbamoyltransferase complex dimerization subunit type 1 TsaB [Fimbriimonadaceae bacterium]